jgi:hypothetical protein
MNSALIAVLEEIFPFVMVVKSWNSNTLQIKPKKQSTDLTPMRDRYCLGGTNGLNLASTTMIYSPHAMAQQPYCYTNLGGDRPFVMASAEWNRK